MDGVRKMFGMLAGMLAADITFMMLIDRVLS